MDCIAHGVAKSRTRLSGFHFHFPLGHSAVCASSRLQVAQLCHLKFQTPHTQDEIVVLDETFDPRGTQIGQV